MSAKHTPGPWTAVSVEATRTMFSHDTWNIFAGEDNVVAVAFTKREAALVAAAPELFEAVTDFVTRYPESAHVRKWRALLEKIEGAK